MSESLTDGAVQAGDIRLHYCEAGAGDALLLLHDLHGGNSGRFHWSKNIGDLSRNFRVIAVDLPTFGGSEAVVLNEPRYPYTARILSEFLKAMGIERAHLAGTGPGAGIAAQVAISYPGQVDRLVITGAGAGKPLFYPGPSEGAQASMRSAFEPGRETIRNALKFLVSDPSLITDDLVQECVDEVHRHPEHLNALRQTPFQFYIPMPPPLEELEKIQAPTLVVWGREDRMGTIDAALRYLHYIPDAQLHIFPNCGNWVPFEQADAWNRIVTDFLAADS